MRALSLSIQQLGDVYAGKSGAVNFIHKLFSRAWHRSSLLREESANESEVFITSAIRVWPECGRIGGCQWEQMADSATKAAAHIHMRDFAKTPAY